MVAFECPADAVQKRCLPHELNAISNAIGFAEHYSRLQHAVIGVYDGAGNVIETHDYNGDFKECEVTTTARPSAFDCII